MSANKKNADGLLMKVKNFMINPLRDRYRNNYQFIQILGQQEVNLILVKTRKFTEYTTWK